MDGRLQHVHLELPRITINTVFALPKLICASPSPLSLSDTSLASQCQAASLTIVSQGNFLHRMQRAGRRMRVRGHRDENGSQDSSDLLLRACQIRHVPADKGTTPPCCLSSPSWKKKLPL